MKYFLVRLVLLLPIAVAAQPESAEQPANSGDNEDILWRGEAVLGFNRSTGNSSTTNLLGKVRLSKKTDDWRQNMQFEVLSRSDNGRKSRQTLIADVQTGYNFAGKGYSFANIRHIADKFGPFSQQGTLSVGVGWQFNKGDRSDLALEAGWGVRASKARNTGAETSEAVARGKGKWEYKLSDSARLVNDFHIESGPKGTVTQSEAAMRVAVSDKLGLRLSYRVNTNSGVSETAKKTDTLTAISVDYLF